MTKPAAALSRGFLATTILCAAAPAAMADHTASVQINAPPANVSTLYDLEGDKIVTALSHSYAIPYSQLQPLIQQELSNALAAELQKIANEEGGGSFPIVRDCPGYCGEVRLSMNAGANFQFTSTNQPVLQIVGAPTDNRLRATLETGARVRVNFDLHAVATDVPNTSVPLPVPPPHDEELDHSFYLDIDIPLKATAQVKLWPTLAQEDLSLEVNGKATVTDNNGLQRELAQLGAELGSLIGFSPGGLLSGGPIAWSITGLIFGNEAGDIIQDMANEAIAEAVAAEIDKAADELEAKLKNELDLAAQQGNNFLQQFRNQTIPVLNITLDQAKNQMGLSEDVRLIKQNTDIRAVATARFTGTGSSKIRGVLRMPKTICEKSSSSLAGGQIVIGVPKEHNQDLAGKVGQSCASAIGGSSRLSRRATTAARSTVRRTDDSARSRTLQRSRTPSRTIRPADQGAVAAQRAPTGDLTVAMSPLGVPFSNVVYRGAVPPTTNLPRWSASANPKLTGDLQDVGSAYECGWEVSGVSPIVAAKMESDEALNARLGDYGFTDARFLISSIANQQAALNWNLTPVTDPDGIVFGGEGPDLEVAICYMDVSGVNDHPSFGEELKQAFDPETCPQCMQQLQDPANRISNPAQRLQRAQQLQNQAIQQAPIEQQQQQQQQQ